MSEAAGLLFFIRRSIESLRFLGDVSKSSVSKPFHQNQQSPKYPNVAMKTESFRPSKSGVSPNESSFFNEGLEQRLAV